MKRLLALCIILCVFGTPASATTFKTTIKGAFITRTPPFRAFGNLSGIGDCQYETIANLTLSRWPKAKISLAQVLSAFDDYGANGDPSYVTTGLWESQDWWMSPTGGFAGHRASQVVEIPESQAVAAANAGGVEVANTGDVRNHMFAIIAATATKVTIVDDGYVYHYTWAWLNWAYTQSGELLDFYSVKWAS